jgi:non-ribosomal peptide synthase protein (TIGR01720 family)
VSREADPPRSLRTRVERLSQSQRSALAARLRLEPARDASSGRSGRLVACVVVAAGRTVDQDELLEHVRYRLADYMVPSAIVFADALPRTAAGKIDRSALRARDWPEAADPDAAAFVEPASEAEIVLAEIWSEVLGLEAVSVHDSFFEVGGDSLLSIRILARANRAGLRIDAQEFFAHPTIAEQAKLAVRSTPAPTQRERVGGPLSLIPIQRWFFERIEVDPQHWNQSLLLRVAPRIDRVRFERAVQRLMNHHDALRARFVQVAGAVRQEIAPVVVEPPVDWADVADSTEAEILRHIEERADRAHRAFQLDRGPLVRFLYFSIPNQAGDRLLVVAHHLVIDVASWQILIEDLESLLGALEGTAGVAQPERTTSLGQWAARLVEYAGTPDVAAQAEHWLRLDGGVEVPTDFSADMTENTVATAFSVSLGLDVAETSRLLTDVPKALRSQANEAVLAALATTLTRWTGRSACRIDLEGHGREPLFDDVDLSRTVGWLTTVFPVALAVGADRSAAAAVRAIQAQLRAIPSRGIGYGLLRYLAPTAGSGLQGLPRSLVCFNYLGRIDAVGSDGRRLSPVLWNVGTVRSLASRRPYLIELDVHVEAGRLVAVWTASQRFHRRDTIAGLAEQFRATLRDIIAAAESGSVAPTPDDFPLADLDAEDLESLSRMIETAERRREP